MENPMTKLLVLLSLAPLFACSGKEESGPPSSVGVSASSLEPFLARTAPQGARPVAEVRASAKDGESVAVQGRAKDFVEGRAVVTVIDPSMPACDEAGPMDDCPTPWDFCCDDPGDIAAASATIELRDQQGPLRQSLKGLGGLNYLDTVVALGEVEKDEAGNLTVIARSLYVEKRRR
jgi:hypothetical protein